MKKKSADRFDVIRISENQRIADEVGTPSERAVTIYVNGDELVTLLASPNDLKELAVGFLYSEGFLKKRESLEKIELDGDGYIWIKGEIESPPKSQRKILTSGCGKGLTFRHAFGELPKIDSNLTISGKTLLRFFKEMAERAGLYRESGGLHSAAICSKEEILEFSEDIGRHNAVDKVLGSAFFKSMPLSDKVLITSGRISSEMAGKAVSARIPIIASRTSPTDASVELARCYDLTLVGYVRANKMTIYSKSERIVNS